ncbi:hypothetical protein QUA41_17440 [Microcoleus sp. Pol11C1]|uniref:hypothetical protein n=1 Tax=unclassified Microcoleus TaxID=2642155 RepID=UPI002FD1B78E
MNNPTETTDIEEFKAYLQDLAAVMKNVPGRTDWKYRSFEELALECGRVMEPKPLPKTIKPGQPRLCYANCQQLALKNRNLTYVEGYAMAQGVSIPLHHAWLLDANGYVIDPTWETPGCCYLGIPLATSWVKSIWNSRKQQGRPDELSILQGNYLEDFSIFKQGFPADALA